MFIRKSKYFAMLQRIKDIEQRLCPLNNHDYVITREYWDSENAGCIIDVWPVRELECAKCGHKTKDGNIHGFQYTSRKTGSLV